MMPIGAGCHGNSKVAHTRQFILSFFFVFSFFFSQSNFLLCWRSYFYRLLYKMRLLCSIQCVIFPAFHSSSSSRLWLEQKAPRFPVPESPSELYELHALPQLMENKFTNLSSSSSVCGNCSSTRDDCPSFIIILEFWKMSKRCRMMKIDAKCAVLCVIFGFLIALKPKANEALSSARVTAKTSAVFQRYDFKQVP